MTRSTTIAKLFFFGLMLALLGGCAASAKEAMMAPSPPMGGDAPLAQVQPEAPSAEAAMSADDMGASAPSESAAMTPTPVAPAAMAPAPSSKAGSGQAAPRQGKEGVDKDAPVENAGARPLLIYEADLGLRVDKEQIPATIEGIIDIAESKGGYLISRTDSSVQVRVPSSALRSALGGLSGLGDVSRRSVRAQDVSEQYHDLEVRLHSLEAVRDRLQQFLARAANVNEAMGIAQKLDQVVQQIDQVKGRMQFLRTRAAFSLISVQVEAKPEAVVVQTPPPPPPPSPRTTPMPVRWLHGVGLETLTNMSEDE